MTRRAAKPERIDSHRLGATAVVLGVVWGVIAIYALHAALDPDNAVLPFENSLRISQPLPQRWAFFTLDSQTQYPVPYLLRDGRWEPVDAAYRGNDFGLDRAIRAPITEAYDLTLDLPDAEWTRCNGPPEGCIARARAIQVQNQVTRPRLCGDVAVVERPILPWSERARNEGKGAVASRVIRLKVLC